MDIPKGFKKVDYSTGEQFMSNKANYYSDELDLYMSEWDFLKNKPISFYNTVNFLKNSKGKRVQVMVSKTVLKHCDYLQSFIKSILK